jgi:hypothetical protein
MHRYFLIQFSNGGKKQINVSKLIFILSYEVRFVLDLLFFVEVGLQLMKLAAQVILKTFVLRRV